MIFISYARKDSKHVDALVAALRVNNYTVWLDTSDIQGGDEWRERLAMAIDEAQAVVVVLSENSVTSDHVVKEVNLADDQKRSIVPVCLSEVTIPSSMGLALSGKQRINLKPDFDAGIAELIRKLENLGVELRKPKPAPEPVKPKRKSNASIHGLGVLGGVSLGELYALFFWAAFLQDAIEATLFMILGPVIGLLVFWPFLYVQNVPPPLTKRRPAPAKFFIGTGGTILSLLVAFLLGGIGQKISTWAGWEGDTLQALGFIGGFVIGIFIAVFAYYPDSDEPKADDYLSSSDSPV